MLICVNAKCADSFLCLSSHFESALQRNWEKIKEEGKNATPRWYFLWWTFLTLNAVHLKPLCIMIRAAFNPKDVNLNKVSSLTIWALPATLTTHQKRKCAKCSFSVTATDIFSGYMVLLVIRPFGTRTTPKLDSQLTTLMMDFGVLLAENSSLLLFFYFELYSWRTSNGKGVNIDSNHQVTEHSNHFLFFLSRLIYNLFCMLSKLVYFANENYT